MLALAILLLDKLASGCNLNRSINAIPCLVFVSRVQGLSA